MRRIARLLQDHVGKTVTPLLVALSLLAVGVPVLFILFVGMTEGQSPPISDVGPLHPAATPRLVQPNELTPIALTAVPGHELGTPKEQQPEEMTSETLKAQYSTEAYAMLLHLEAASGDTSKCSDPCILPIGVESNLEIVRNRCISRDPSPWLSQFGADPAVGPLISGFKETCDAFREYMATLGIPADTPAWRGAVLELVQQLTPVLDAVQNR
jgi:hypothetical protein